MCDVITLGNKIPNKNIIFLSYTFRYIVSQPTNWHLYSTSVKFPSCLWFLFFYFDQISKIILWHVNYRLWFPFYLIIVFNFYNCYILMAISNYWSIPFTTILIEMVIFLKNIYFIIIIDILSYKFFESMILE